MKFAGLYLRILVAWLLVVQPMYGAHASAQTANAPYAAELCRGGPAPSADLPAQQQDRDHSGCCVSCLPLTAPPPREIAVGTPVPATVERGAVCARQAAVAHAGLGPQSARAPPL